MAARTPTRGRLRRLAEIRPDRGRVLSVFFDLDPSTFATGEARATQINSVFDEAGRRVDAEPDLTHDERSQLRADVERLRGLFDPQTMAAGGARGIAVFACEAVGLLEVVRTPYPLETRVVIGDAPHLEPLAVAPERERLCVVLTSTGDSRIFVGDEDRLEEIEGLENFIDRGTKAQERLDHLDAVAAALFTLLRRRPFERLLVGGPDPLPAALEERLHPYVRERLGGRVSADISSANAEQVLAAAQPALEEHRRGREREAVERLRAGLGSEGGRAVAGLEDTLAALEQQRVEVLMLEPKPGGHGELQEREEAIETAVERALGQAAEILVMRHLPDLGPHGGIAALLRF